MAKRLPQPDGLSNSRYKSEPKDKEASSSSPWLYKYIFVKLDLMSWTYVAGSPLMIYLVGGASFSYGLNKLAQENSNRYHIQQLSIVQNLILK